MTNQPSKLLYKYSVVVLTFLLFVLTGCGKEEAVVETKAQASSDKVMVEVLYLPHPPVKKAMKEIETLLKSFGDKVSVHMYSFDSPEGATLAEQKGVKGHTPIVIYVNGSMEYEIGEKKGKFYSFPQGSGTMMMGDGGWSLQDLETVITKVVNGGKS